MGSGRRTCKDGFPNPPWHTADNIAQADETNIFRWQVALMVVNPESAFNGGYLKVSRASTQWNRKLPSLCLEPVLI